jgi:hypothetical protein
MIFCKRITHFLQSFPMTFLFYMFVIFTVGLLLLFSFQICIYSPFHDIFKRSGFTFNFLWILRWFIGIIFVKFGDILSIPGVFACKVFVHLIHQLFLSNMWNFGVIQVFRKFLVINIRIYEDAGASFGLFEHGLLFFSFSVSSQVIICSMINL